MRIFGQLGSLIFTWCLFACASAQGGDSGQRTHKFSEAEQRLWSEDQLASISRPTDFIYSFEKSGALEVGFRDEVRFSVERVNEDGTKVVTLAFFTGERNHPVPSLEKATSNPVLTVYLQGDVYEMNRRTDPQGAARERWRYFQRRIKLALSESATVREVTFQFDGRNWNGYEVYFEPYKNDPKRNLFDQLSRKSYTVVVSQDLPGYLYKIETYVPAASGSTQPLLKERLQLSKIEIRDATY